MVFYTSGKKITDDKIKDNVIDFWPTSANFILKDAMYTLPSAFLAYNFHYNLFPIFVSMKDQQSKIMYNCVLKAQSFCCLTYISMALCGYVSYGNGVKGDYINSFKIEDIG